MVFTTYLLVLMVVPCNDHPEQLTNTEQSAHKDSNHKDDLDLCTPFCTCSSCMAAIVLQPQFEFSFYFPNKTSAEISNFYKSVNSQFYGSIWQPPKLV